MNDFTKEELNILMAAITIWVKEIALEGSTTSPNLKSKIQFMIDYYKDSDICQHKEIITGAYPRSDPPKKCEICGVLYR